MNKLHSDLRPGSGHVVLIGFGPPCTEGPFVPFLAVARCRMCQSFLLVHGLKVRPRTEEKTGFLSLSDEQSCGKQPCYCHHEPPNAATVLNLEDPIFSEGRV